MKIKNQKTGREIVIPDSSDPSEIIITDGDGKRYTLQEWKDKKNTQKGE